MAQQKGYLSHVQVQIVESRINYNASYNKLIKQFSISGRTALTHALFRTATLQFWTHKMTAQDRSYLSKYDADLFLKIIEDASNDKNCIPVMYGVSLVCYFKKRNIRAFHLLEFMHLSELATKINETTPYVQNGIDISKHLLNLVIQ